MGRRTPATHRDLIMDPVSRPSHCVKHIRICEFALSAVGFWTSSSKWMKTRELLISGAKLSRSRSPEERDPLPHLSIPLPSNSFKSQCTHYQVATITASTAHRYPAGIPLNSQARRTHSGLSRFLPSWLQVRSPKKRISCLLTLALAGARACIGQWSPPTYWVLRYNLRTRFFLCFFVSLDPPVRLRAKSSEKRNWQWTPR